MMRAGPAAPVAGCVQLERRLEGQASDLQEATVPLVFHLKSAEGAVTGAIEGLPSGPVEIHDGKIDGDTVTFKVNADYRGQHI